MAGVFFLCRKIRTFVSYKSFCYNVAKGGKIMKTTLHLAFDDNERSMILQSLNNPMIVFDFPQSKLSSKYRLGS